MIGFKTKEDKRSMARTAMDDRLNSGEIGQHLCCTLCYPSRPRTGDKVVAICGATMQVQKDGELISANEAKADGVTCPLCLLVTEEHMEEKHSDYISPHS